MLVYNILWLKEIFSIIDREFQFLLWILCNIWEDFLLYYLFIILIIVLTTCLQWVYNCTIVPAVSVLIHPVTRSELV